MATMMPEVLPASLAEVGVGCGRWPRTEMTMYIGNNQFFAACRRPFYMRFGPHCRKSIDGRS